MGATLLIAKKDLRLILRDRAGLFWIAAFPVLFALFLGAVLERWSARDDLTLSVVVSDLDRSPESRAFLERLEEAGSLNVQASALEAGRARLRHGDIDALVVLLPGFGAIPDWFSGSAEVMHVEADPSRKREASYVKGLLLETGLARAIEDQLTTDPRSAVRIVPISARSAVRSEPTPAELVAPAAVLWGLIGCAAAFAISLATERRAGTLQRLRSLPLADWQVLAGKAVACWVACLAIALVIVIGALALFGVRLASPLGLALTLPALAFCFTGIMALISTIGTSERSVAGAGWGTLLVFGMLGGVMVPRMIMPPWLVSIGAFSPVRWGLVALEHALWRGGRPLDWLGPCAMLVALGLAGLGIGAMMLRRSTP
jgi:ABC-2 type transport system permease protein